MRTSARRIARAAAIALAAAALLPTALPAHAAPPAKKQWIVNRHTGWCLTASQSGLDARACGDKLTYRTRSWELRDNGDGDVQLYANDTAEDVRGCVAHDQGKLYTVLQPCKPGGSNGPFAWRLLPGNERGTYEIAAVGEGECLSGNEWSVDGRQELGLAKCRSSNLTDWELVPV